MEWGDRQGKGGRKKMRKIEEEKMRTSCRRRESRVGLNSQEVGTVVSPARIFLLLLFYFFFLPLFSVNIAFLSSTFRSTFPAKTFAQYIHAKRRVIRQCDDDQERLLSDTKRNVMFHAIPPYNFMMASMRDVGSHRNTKNRSHNGRLKSTLAFLQRSIYRE